MTGSGDRGASSDSKQAETEMPPTAPPPVPGVGPNLLPTSRAHTFHFPAMESMTNEGKQQCIGVLKSLLQQLSGGPSSSHIGPDSYGPNHVWAHLLSDFPDVPSVQVSGAVFAIGRSSRCNLQLRDTVGSIVCRIVYTPNTKAVGVLEGCTSNDVLTVNNQHVRKGQKVELKSGDTIVIISSMRTYSFLFAEEAGTTTANNPTPSQAALKLAVALTDDGGAEEPFEEKLEKLLLEPPPFFEFPDDGKDGVLKDDSAASTNTTSRSEKNSELNNAHAATGGSKGEAFMGNGEPKSSRKRKGDATLEELSVDVDGKMESNPESGRSDRRKRERESGGPPLSPDSAVRIA